MAYQHPPQKRDESLQPLSRDHYVGLVHAEHLRKSGSSDTDAATRRQVLGEFIEAWQRDIREHFDDEERLLETLMTQAEVDELHRQHHTLRTMAQQANEQYANAAPDPDWCCSLGETLRDHIRWEERTLFPAIQARATPDQLELLAEHTKPIEQRRGRSNDS
jgi:hemerythrin